jgi:hypothetical protein
MPSAQYSQDTDNDQHPSKPRADQLIQLHQHHLGLRKNWEGTWQTLHDYFYVESSDFNKSYSPGNELDAACLWDATTLDTADVLASGFMNYLTPPSSKWFRLRHKDQEITAKKSVTDYLEDVANEANYTLNRSNFYDQMFPGYKGSGVYGTAMVFEEEDILDDARFSNMPLKQVVIVEDARGRVVAYFIEFEYTANQAASRWGVEALSREMQQEIREQKGDSTKHKFLLYIAKRHVREVQKTDKKNLPIEAVWVDVKARMVVEESGYNEFPAFCHRFDKRPFIPWGFSPAMKALPFARMLNAIAKTNLRSMMKWTDPPMALPHGAFISPFNSNPRAVNYYKKDLMDSKGIFSFGNFGDPKVGVLALEYYANQVKTMMYHDAFLAFSNIKKEMNNPEVMERINEKMTMLGPAVGRYTSEVLNPIVQRTIGILWRRGRLPKPPKELIENPNYEIDFVGVLAQAQRRSELNTLSTGLAMIGQMAQYVPEVLDKINPDRVVDETWAITGAPVKVLRDDAEVKEIREGRAETMMAQQEMMKVAGGAQVAKDAGSAAKSFADAEKK